MLSLPVDAMLALPVDQKEGRMPCYRGAGLYASFAAERCGSVFWHTQPGQEIANTIEDMW